MWRGVMWCDAWWCDGGGAVWCGVMRSGVMVVVVVRCGAVWCDAWWWCGVVWWWCGAVRHPSIGQGRQYQSLSGTSPGHSPGNRCHIQNTGTFGRTIQRNTTTRQDNTDNRLRKSAIRLLQHEGLLCTNTAHMYTRIVALCVPSLYILMVLKLHTKSHRSNADTGEISMAAHKRRVDNPDPDDDGKNWITSSCGWTTRRGEISNSPRRDQ